MELTELSLAPSQLNSSFSESENNFSSSSSSSRKRKFFSDHHLLKRTLPPFQTSTVDLHVKEPLPMDWEQCLDLESGKMYYLNRKTLRKSWNWPKVDQKLDLELNMSPLSDSPNHHQPCRNSNHINNSSLEEYSKKLHASSSFSNNNTVALACLNCHLLVILSKSSPSCPNCKYVHSLPTHQASQPKISPTKSLNTLSLLN
ncbi:uncharacterized protein LOC110627065 [Manihot esculenta]|uniref:WW domain-containing protein n=1 Tax=Manihot esculenta TaxID=3983 RepID=A0A2C9V0J2_MANES|nr:uncharacterized protein LOC110627065 [Manihot esculenta]OAY37607.1 hypothetical protein MANES_11G114400v8 [Manihot esculenta]